MSDEVRVGYVPMNLYLMDEQWQELRRDQHYFAPIRNQIIEGVRRMIDQPVRDIHDLLTQGAVPKPEVLLGADEKESLAEAGTAFIVNEISMGDDSEYGPFWQVKATLNGDPVSFRLSQHDRRDAFMQSIAGALTAGPIGGLRLVAYPGRGGNQFITIEPS